MGEQSASDADAVSAEEWNVIHALRRLGQTSVHLAADASQDDLESAYRRLENGILEDVATTLDRMIDRADQTSGQLDILIRRLSETAGTRRPAA